MCSHVGDHSSSPLILQRGESEAQGGDRICKLVAGLGCGRGHSGFWLFALPMTQAAFSIRKGAQRNIPHLPPPPWGGRAQSPDIPAQPSSEMSRREVGWGSFWIKVETGGNGSVLGHRHLVVQPWAGHTTSLIRGFSITGREHNAFLTGCREDRMGCSCERLSTAPGTR